MPLLIVSYTIETPLSQSSSHDNLTSTYFGHALLISKFSMQHFFKNHFFLVSTCTYLQVFYLSTYLQVLYFFVNMHFQHMFNMLFCYEKNVFRIFNIFSQKNIKNKMHVKKTFCIGAKLAPKMHVQNLRFE